MLLITDQQRYPQHWPDEPGWMRELMPNDAELARTGLSFTQAFCNTCMCTPSRATLFSGQYPAQHGLPLTLTMADLLPDPRNLPFVLETAGRMGVRGEVTAGGSRGRSRAASASAGREAETSPS